MKGIVIYYSATGSTAKIAQAIHKGMSKELEVCDLASVRKADPAAMGQYDLVVVGSPIWYRRETANLRDFLYNMPDMRGKLCVLFCTHGVGPDGLMLSLSTQVKRKGMTIIGWNDWYGSVYQVLHQFKPYVTDGHPDEIDLKEAEEFGREMGQRAKKIAAGDTSLIPKPGTDTLWKIHTMPKDDPQRHGMPPPGRPGPGGHEGNGGPGGPGEFGDDGPKFRPLKAVRTFNMEKCIHPSCTKCMDTCPINAIDFSSGTPTVKNGCIDCALCDKMCPVGAIEINEEAMLQRTQHVIDMEKCKYPACTICVDYCPMQSIDFSVNPPAFKKNCEGDDLCWVICPHDAIGVTNLDKTHELLGSNSPDSPFLRMVEANEATGKFRRLVPRDQINVMNKIMYNPNAPRFVIEHEEP